MDVALNHWALGLQWLFCMSTRIMSKNSVRDHGLHFRLVKDDARKHNDREYPRSSYYTNGSEHLSVVDEILSDTSNQRILCSHMEEISKAIIVRLGSTARLPAQAHSRMARKMFFILMLLVHPKHKVNSPLQSLCDCSDNDSFIKL